MQSIEVKKGVLLNALVLNPGVEETIVMIHGMFGNLAQFYMTIAPDLSRDFRIVLYDIRSHGKSDKQASGYDLISLTDDLHALLNSLNIKKCHLLGFSYGALIALRYAMRFNERVEKIIAVEIPPKSLLPAAFKGSYSFDNFLGFAATLTPRVYENFMRSKRQIEKTYAMYHYIFNHTSFVDDMNQEEIFMEADYKLIKAPILLFFGRNSPCMPELNRVHNWIISKMVIVEEGGHGFFIERPADSSIKMKNFLHQVETPANAC